MTNSHTQTLPQFHFDNTFARNLDSFFVAWTASESQSPKLIKFNHGLAEELKLDSLALDSEVGANIFSGNHLPEGSEPLAQVYAGHQFGGFSPQLGDGRALLLGEVIDTHHRRRDIQLKGSGRTPFSRGGDGKATLGPILREYLIGEAMYALGIPTTRALAAVTTGEKVHRETELPGAILTRVAASHIRVGTFQYFAARKETEQVRKLADYAIERHYPEVKETQNRYLAFFESVTSAQASLVAKWMAVGFIHGVMNTDNMTISGETIDYGPCAFMDSYSPETVFSSIDTHGRYAYGNQPLILVWNLARLAETLVPLVEKDTDRSLQVLTDKVSNISSIYEKFWLTEMRAKIGLKKAKPGDLELINDFCRLLQDNGTDYTLVFRHLSKAVCGNPDPVRRMFEKPAKLDDWLNRWRIRLEEETTTSQILAFRMDKTNPIYIPRNHMVENALSAAVETGDMDPFSTLLSVLGNPFEIVDGKEKYTSPAPLTDTPYQTFCGT